MSFDRFVRYFFPPGRLDRWVVRPFAWILGALVSRSENRRGAEGNDPERICLLKFSGLGSVVNTLPLLQALKARYPRAAILYLSWESNRELAARVREIDRFIGVETRPFRRFITSLLSAVREVRRFSPDLSIDLQVYKIPAFTSLLTRFSGAGRTLSFIRPSQEFRRRLVHTTLPFNERHPLSESFARIGIEAGVEWALHPHDPLPVLERDCRELAVQNLPDTPGTRLLVINPNASSFCLERRWPILYFSETASHLLDRFPDLSVLLIGSEDEREYVDRLERCLNRGNRVINMAGLLSLGGLLALLDRCDGFLTNDSGPMHLGFLMGTPTIALFGPADPRNHSIHADPALVSIHYKKIPCSPCVHQFEAAPCLGHNLCMQQISPPEVIRACASFLQRRPRAVRKKDPSAPSFRSSRNRVPGPRFLIGNERILSKGAATDRATEPSEPFS
jgi:ADP-heptose:LPS heptosyltransferase